MTLPSTTKNILTELRSVLNTITDQDYQKPIPVLNNATIGMHVRHILEFFMCLNEGYYRGIVNYDNRKRNKQIEKSLEYACIQINKITNAIGEFRLDHDLLLEFTYDETGYNQVQIKTNYNRELAYNIEHAVHHMALLRIGLTEVAPDVKLSEYFGVAVSTVRHQQLQNVVNG